MLFTLPHLSLTLDGIPLTSDGHPLLNSLTMVRVQQRISLPTLCELTFSNPPHPQKLLQPFQLGSLLRLTIENQSEPLFAGQLTAIEHFYQPNGQQQIHLRAYDHLYPLRKQQAVRAYVQLTATDLAMELIAPLGLQLQVDVSGPVYPLLIQHAQSHLELLTEILERAGIYFFLRDNQLHLFTLAGTGNPIPLHLGQSLLEAHIQLNDTPAVQTIKATGWSPLAMESFTTETNQARTGRKTEATATWATNHQRHLVNQPASDPDQIEALAQAELDHHTANQHTFWGVAQGNTALQPGYAIQLHNLADPLNGQYILTTVIHTIDPQHGYLSELSTALPQPIHPPKPNPQPLVTWGVVTSVADPHNMGRVRVSFPTYNDVESEWLQVVAPAAGVHKGLVALPDVQDNVLVLFTHADPAQAIVLGSIYGPFAPYDTGVEGNSIKRYSFRSLGGHLIRLDDQTQTLRIEASNGSYVEFAPHKTRLFTTANLEISAPNKTIIIEGKAIEFREAL